MDHIKGLVQDSMHWSYCSLALSHRYILFQDEYDILDFTMLIFAFACLWEHKSLNANNLWEKVKCNISLSVYKEINSVAW